MNLAFTKTTLETLLPSLVGASLVVALLLPHSVAAFFTDTETSGGERFVAAELLLLPISDKAATVNGTEAPGSFTANVLLTNDSTAANYDIAVTNTTGNQDFCDALTLRATSTEAVIGDQTLPNFASGVTSLSGIWDFAASMETVPLGLSDGSTCTATFLATAWQRDLTKTAPGYFDTTTFTATFTYLIPSPDPVTTVAPTPPPATNPDDNEAQAGDIVINEIMWMGSSAGPSDEWLELRNTTNSAIDISNWTINNSQASNGTTTIAANTTIPAQGIYLLAAQDLTTTNTAIQNTLPADQWQQVSDLSLANDYTTNDALELRNDSNTLMDITPTPESSTWPHGESDAGTARWSMQRGANPGDGSNSSNWYTCTPSVLQADGTYSTMQGYWQAGTDINCGTPGQENLSSNDPTKPGYADWLASQNTAASTEPQVASSESNGSATEKDNDDKDGHSTMESASSPEDNNSNDETTPDSKQPPVPDNTTKTTPPSTSASSRDEEQSEDTESAPVPDPDPVVKRSEEEDKPSEQPAGDEAASEPEEAGDAAEKKDSKATANAADDETNKDTDATDEGSTPNETPVIDESGSTPNDDNA